MEESIGILILVWWILRKVAPADWVERIISRKPIKVDPQYREYPLFCEGQREFDQRNECSVDNINFLLKKVADMAGYDHRNISAKSFRKGYAQQSVLVNKVQEASRTFNHKSTAVTVNNYAGHNYTSSGNVWNQTASSTGSVRSLPKVATPYIPVVQNLVYKDYKSLAEFEMGSSLSAYETTLQNEI